MVDTLLNGVGKEVGYGTARKVQTAASTLFLWRTKTLERGRNPQPVIYRCGCADERWRHTENPRYCNRLERLHCARDV